jgi:hypothetical protein
MKFPKFKFKSFFSGVMGCLIVLGIIGFILRLYLKVKAGEGLEYYISGTGYKLNYIGVLALFILLPFVMVGGWLVGKVLTWRDKKIEKKQIQQRIEKNRSKRKRKT